MQKILHCYMNFCRMKGKKMGYYRSKTAFEKLGDFVLTIRNDQMVEQRVQAS